MIPLIPGALMPVLLQIAISVALSFSSSFVPNQTAGKKKLMVAFSDWAS
jgi:hypothetical protein